MYDARDSAPKRSRNNMVPKGGLAVEVLQHVIHNVRRTCGGVALVNADTADPVAYLMLRRRPDILSSHQSHHTLQNRPYFPPGQYLGTCSTT